MPTRRATEDEILTILQERPDELRDLIGNPSAEFAIHGNGSGGVVAATIPSIETTVEMEVDDETIEISVQLHTIQPSPLQAAIDAAIARSAYLQSVVTDLLQQVKTLQNNARIGCFNGPCQRFAAVLAI